MQSGYLGLIGLLLSLLIIGLMFLIMNPFSDNQESEITPIEAENIDDIDPQTITNPKRIQQAQDAVDNLQQKSIENQSIEIE